MTMANIGRRGFVKGATLGALAFTVGGAEVIMAAGEARARGVPFRLLDAHQGETLEALGETLVPQAREAGIAHFIDQQLSVPPHESLLQARIFNFRPPFAEFYRTAITAVDEGGRKLFGRDFAQLPAADQRALVEGMRQKKLGGWTGRPATIVYALLRADAVDVVYGTMEGYEALGIPYMPHIPPEKRWRDGQRESRRCNRCRGRVRLGLCIGAGEGGQESGPAGVWSGLGALRSHQLRDMGSPHQAGGRANPARGQKSDDLRCPGRVGRLGLAAALLRPLSAPAADRFQSQERAQPGTGLADRLRGRGAVLRQGRARGRGIRRCQGRGKMAAGRRSLSDAADEDLSKWRDLAEGI